MIESPISGSTTDPGALTSPSMSDRKISGELLNTLFSVTSPLTALTVIVRFARASANAVGPKGNAGVGRWLVVVANPRGLPLGAPAESRFQRLTGVFERAGSPKPPSSGAILNNPA
jgi:hypothetical protein